MPQSNEAKQKQEELADQNSSKESPNKEQLEQMSLLKAQVNDLQRQLQVERDEKTREAEMAERAKRQAMARDLAEKSKVTKQVKGVDNLEELSNKELVDILASAVDESSSANMQQIVNAVEQKIRESDEKLDLTNKVLMKVLAKMDVEDTRKKFPDFDEYRQEVADVMERIPGITSEEAMILAKSKRAGSNPPAKSVETERPNQATSRSAQQLADNIDQLERRDETRSARSGVRSFRDIVNKGAEKVISSRRQT